MMQGRTVLVTEGTAGIGYEVARAFAGSCARVLLLSRKVENGDKAVTEIKKAVFDEAYVHFTECDLGNLVNVKEVGDKIRGQEERLDIIIADAGVGVNRFDLSSELTAISLKTSKLADATAPRVVSISSELPRVAPSSVKFASKEEVLDNQAREHPFTKYILVEKAFEPAGNRILAVVTHSGAVHTGQQDQFKEAYGPLVGSLPKAFTVLFMRNLEQGSVSTLWAATAEDVKSSAWQGFYFTDPGQVGKPIAQACDKQLGENLHKLSEDLIKDKIGQDALFQ